MQNAWWFIAAIAAIVAAWLFSSPYVAFAVYAFLLLLGLAFLSAAAWTAGLDAERTVTPHVLQQGEDVTVAVTITNRRGFPIPWLFVEDHHPPDFTRHGQNKRLAILMPGRSLELAYRLTCPRRGYHRIGPVLMESGDVFGLQRRFRTGNQQDYVSVLPTIAYIETFTIAARRPMGPVRITNRIYEDPTRINNLREYAPGDPMRAIHWKATARTGQLHVKTYEPSNVLGATLVLDLHEDNYVPQAKEERIELAITTTASIAWLLQMSGEQLGLLTNARDAAEVARYEAQARHGLSREEIEGLIVENEQGRRISPLSVPTLRSQGQAQRIAENLARVLPGRGLDPERMLMSEFQHLPRDAALLPVLPQVTEQMALMLASMKLSGFTVTVFLIKAGRAYEEAARLLAPHEINVLHIEEERHLHELSPARIGR